MKLKHLMTTWALLLGAATMQAQDITFYTPNTVRVVKESGTQNAKAGKKSLVVIANPEKVSVKQSKNGSATIYKSSALTVKL